MDNNTALNFLFWSIGISILLYVMLHVVLPIINLVVEWRVDINRSKLNQELKEIKAKLEIISKQAKTDYTAKTVTVTLPMVSGEEHYSVRTCAFQRSFNNVKSDK